MSQVLSFHKLTAIESIAIDQTANGLTSGHLEEWPYLMDALDKLNLPCNPDIPYTRLITLCKLIQSSRSSSG